MAVVSYSLAKLPHNEKMKVNYRLFRKQNREGLVEESGGAKLVNGCFVIPAENLDEAIATLKQFGVQFDAKRVYVSSPTTSTKSQTKTMELWISPPPMD